MGVLGYCEKELLSLGGYHTAMEIAQQPDVWVKVWQAALDRKGEIKSFLDKALSKSHSIILTGAGTSAFIGISLKGVFANSTGLITESISTTDLVSHPTNYLQRNHPILLVSFARSGDSPESKAALKLADEYSQECYHLIITCNPKGELAKGTTKNGKYVFLLPEEANDRSLAMTSSYSGMLLAGMLIARINEIESLQSRVNLLSEYGRNLINRSDRIKDLANLNFKRAVFLGSGPQYGTAKESHLKLQELTDGKVICKHDSYLGFRHGPKAVIDNSTLVVYLLSNQPYVQKYERDMVNSMHTDNKAMLEVAVMEREIEGINIKESFLMNCGEGEREEEMLPVCSIIPAQIFGFHKSVALGLSPDKPSNSGAISRVVEGVKIYDL